MISLIKEYEIFQFSKRGYTTKYPGFSIPSNLSTPAIKNIIVHLQTSLANRLGNNTDKEADKFDGTNANYDEKTSLQKE